jgi:hypothetical protein
MDAQLKSDLYATVDAFAPVLALILVVLGIALLP